MPGIQNSRRTLDFLGTIGTTDRGDDVKLNNTAKALVKLAGILMDTATKNMDKVGGVATGGILSSMKAVNLQTNGTKYSLDIEIDSAYKFTDKGVKGVRGGKSHAGYSFKTMRPSKKMATQILKWARKRAIASKYKAISKNEKKSQSIKKKVSASEDLKRMAYAMSTNIKKKGIKPTLFFTNAIKEAQRQKKKIISDGFKLDIIETINGS